MSCHLFQCLFFFLISYLYDVDTPHSCVETLVISQPFQLSSYRCFITKTCCSQVSFIHFFYIITLLYTVLFFRVLSPLLSPSLSSSQGKRGFLSESPEHLFLFCLISSFKPFRKSLYLSFYQSVFLSFFLFVCLSLSLTVTWIGSVETTPSHWTRFCYTHVDTHRKTTWRYLCMIFLQWTLKSIMWHTQNKLEQTVGAAILHGICRPSLPDLINLECI